MAQQQRRLSEETLGTIKEGLAPVHKLIEKVENKVTKGIQAALHDVQGLSEGQEELERSMGQAVAGPNFSRAECLLRGKVSRTRASSGALFLTCPYRSS